MKSCRGEVNKKDKIRKRYSGKQSTQQVKDKREGESKEIKRMTAAKKDYEKYKRKEIQLKLD